jgi:hypothetical protein
MLTLVKRGLTRVYEGGGKGALIKIKAVGTSHTYASKPCRHC